MTKSVVCFGEALIDFLNTGQVEGGVLELNQFTQIPGGAPANVAVAVAKLGVRARFAGQVGSDYFGNFIIDALRAYGVDTSLTLQHPAAEGYSDAVSFANSVCEHSGLRYYDDSKIKRAL